MKKKRLLTLDDLYNYYSSNTKSSHFNAKDDDENIVVQVSGTIKFEENDKNTEGLLPVTLRACHTDKNVNGSNITKERMEEALPSFYNRPIMGYIHLVDGQYEFYAHNMHEDEDGNIVYDESPVGIIPESGDVHLEYNEEMDKYQVVVNGYIFEEYTKAADILRREEECYVSVELSIRELQYNAKEKYLDIIDFFFSAVTILGKNPDGTEVKPGMQNSNIKLADFKQKNCKTFSQEDVLKKLEELTKKVDALSIDNSKKGGIGDLDFENENEVITEEVNNEEFAEESETSEEVVEEPVQNETVEETSEEIVEETVEEETPVEEKFQKVFSISHEDIKYALYTLLMPYEEADNDYYYISAVYDDSFTYEGMFSGAIFGQKYTKDGDNVAFDGERYTLHRELLTDSEYAQLNEMRSNYSSLLEYKNNKEEEIIRNEKMSVLEKYENIANTEEYSQLLNNIDNYSKEEIEEKADAIVGKYARQGIQFSFKNESNKSISIPVQKELEKLSYGGLFD